MRFHGVKTFFLDFRQQYDAEILPKSTENTLYTPYAPAAKDMNEAFDKIMSLCLYIYLYVDTTTRYSHGY